MIGLPPIEPRTPQQDLRLLEAARYGETARVAQLINDGTDLDAQDDNGRTALMFASMAGRAPVVRLLLDAGADRTIKDNSGGDAYDCATFYGDFKGATMPPYDEIVAMLSRGG